MKLDTNASSVYIKRGLSYDRKGDYDKAVADYMRAIELTPNDTTTYSYL